ncbi:MAG: recombination regulator RecX [Defluviitaleaceae bacterium]|nr:recombination regulator RecX [Defluviitaleaceae bacterium]
MNTDTYNNARKKALQLLSYGPRSRRGLTERLIKAGYTDNDIIEAILIDMEGLGFVNDVKMAADYVAYAVESKGYGRYRILNELDCRGIEKDIAEESYNNYITQREAEADGEFDRNAVDTENATSALKKRLQQTGLDADELDHADVRRLTAFLHRRGFSFDVISRAFKGIKEMDEQSH